MSNNTVKLLNDLVQLSENAKKGFAAAVENATKPELKAIFQRCFADCDTAVIELQRLVESLGGTAESSGTVAAGAARRSLATVTIAVDDADIAALEETARAEDETTAACAKALIVELPHQIRNVVQHQHDDAARNRELICDLRDSYRSAKETVSI